MTAPFLKSNYSYSDASVYLAINSWESMSRFARNMKGVWLVVMLLTAQRDGISTAIEKVPMLDLEQCRSVGSVLRTDSIDIKFLCIEGARSD